MEKNKLYLEKNPTAPQFQRLFRKDKNGHLEQTLLSVYERDGKFTRWFGCGFLPEVEEWLPALDLKA